MATITQLVDLRIELLKLRQKLSFDQEIKNNIKYLEFIRSNYTDPDITDMLIDSCINSLEQDNKIQQNLEIAISTTETRIDTIVQAHSPHIYFKHNMIPHNVSIELDKISEEIITTKINSYSNWKYPGMLLNVKNKKHIDMMISSDPLYLVYSDQSELDEILENYTNLYRRRLRLYHLVDITKDIEFNYSLATHLKKIYPFSEEFVDTTATKKFDPVAYSLLPINQFSLVLCWDTLNYVGLAKIEQYLKVVFELLRPGGTFIFNYNNCDLPNSALRAEKDEMSYSNSRIIKKLSENIGYDPSFTDLPIEGIVNTHVSWAELTKPGKLYSSKAQQVLGEIIEN